MKSIQPALILNVLLLAHGWQADAAPTDRQERVLESILPSLAYGPSCWSGVELQNLGDRTVVVDVEAHRGSGALVPLVGHPEMTIRLSPGERGAYKLQLEEETINAWVKVREKVASLALTPVVAVSGTTECVVGDQLRTTSREVVYPTRNAWFSGEVAGRSGGMILLVNTSEHTAKASACYSSGGLFSVPNETRPTAELNPICSGTLDVQIPPFGTFQFPLERDGNSRFTLKTTGEAIALQMLRPVQSAVKMYSVDSTVTFGGEAPKN